MPAALIPSRLTVDTDTIRAYAELTADWNPIHVDETFAAASPMGGPIAHGTMSMNLLWQSLSATFGDDAVRGIALDVRFVRPVRVGDTVEAGGAPAADGPRWDVWVRNGAGETVIAGTARLAVPEPLTPEAARRAPSPTRRSPP